MKFKFAAVVLISAGGFLMSQERFDFKVRNYFFAGFTGDAASLEKGMKICEEALAADPKNAQALVWHGSGVFFQAGQAFQKGDSQKGMELWQRGLKEMSDAVTLAPDALAVVIPRGAVAAHGISLCTAGNGTPAHSDRRAGFREGLRITRPGFEPTGNASPRRTHDRPGRRLQPPGRPGKGAAMVRAHPERNTRHAVREVGRGWLETKTLAPAQAGCLGCHTGK